MADFDAIRRGLAALLRDALPEDEGHVSPWLQDNPQVPTLCVAGVEADGIQYVTFGDPPGMEITFVIEAWLGAASDIAAQKWLDRFLSSDALATALESDGDAAGALKSRLQDDGTVDTGQDPAADSVAVMGYMGQTRLARGTGDVLLAQWRVRVVA